MTTFEIILSVVMIAFIAWLIYAMDDFIDDE